MKNFTDTHALARKFEVGDKLLEKYVNQTKYSTYFQFLVASICGSRESNDPWGVFLSNLYLRMYNDFNDTTFIGFKCFNRYYHKQDLKKCFTYVVGEYIQKSTSEYKLSKKIYSGIFQGTPSK